MFFMIFYVSWVVCYDFFAKFAPVDMSVDFGCGNAFVAEHLLNCPQVGSALKQVGGERMAERVRTDRLFNSGNLDQLFNNMENHYP